MTHGKWADSHQIDCRAGSGPARAGGRADLVRCRTAACSCRRGSWPGRWPSPWRWGLMSRRPRCRAASAPCGKHSLPSPIRMPRRPPGPTSSIRSPKACVGPCASARSGSARCIAPPNSCASRNAQADSGYSIWISRAARSRRRPCSSTSSAFPHTVCSSTAMTGSRPCTARTSRRSFMP